MRRFLLISALFSVLGPPANAVSVELMPMVGFQFNGSRDLAGPTYDRLDLRNVALRGFSLGYFNDQNGQLEASWTRSNSSAQIQKAGGAIPDNFDVTVQQFHLNGLYMFADGSLQPFFLFGAGATLMSPSGPRSSTTLFSMAFGSGIKWLWNDHIGIRLDARWTPALAFQGKHFFCDETGSGSCYSAESNSYASHIFPLLNSVDLTAGLLLRY